MNWTQVIDPLANLALSALLASLPIFFIFWALILKKMMWYKASLLTLLLAIVVATIIYGMPVQLALLSGLYGAMYGLFPICWIILGAVFLFNLTVKSGQYLLNINLNNEDLQTAKQRIVLYLNAF
jgi:lactate permease